MIARFGRLLLLLVVVGVGVKISLPANYGEDKLDLFASEKAQWLQRQINSLDFRTALSDDRCSSDTCAYATFLSNEEEVAGLIALVASHATVKSSYSLQVLYPEHGSALFPVPEVRHQIEKLGGQLRPVKLEQGSQQANASTCALEHIIKLTDYKKVVYLNPATLIRKNPDWLFTLRHDIAGIPEYGDSLDEGVLLLRPRQLRSSQLLRDLKHQWQVHGVCSLPKAHSNPSNKDVGIIPTLYDLQPRHLRHYASDIRPQDAVIWNFSGPMKPWSFFRSAEPHWDIEIHQWMFAEWRLFNIEVQKRLRPTARAGLNDGEKGIEDREMIVQRLDSKGYLKGSEELIPSCAGTQSLREETEYPEQEKYSVALMFHNPTRLSFLAKLIAHYNTSPFVERVFVVWAAKDLEIPDSIRSIATVYTANTESINARFMPLPDLKTQAVFIADDDILYNLADVDAVFDSWLNRQDSAVGFFGRIHVDSQGKFSYLDDKLEYSMILTKGLMINARYLHAYTCMLPNEIHAYVDSLINCEDIAMNMMITGTSGARPLSIWTRDRVWDFGGKNGISSSSSHYDVRTQCLADLTTLFGAMTLRITGELVDVRYQQTRYKKPDWPELDARLDYLKSAAASR